MNKRQRKRAKQIAEFAKPGFDLMFSAIDKRCRELADAERRAFTESMYLGVINQPTIGINPTKQSKRWQQ